MKKLLDFLPKFEMKSAASRSSSKTFGAKEFLTLMIHWELVVGEKMSKLTRPQGLREGTLTIASLDPAYSGQLLNFSQVIIERINTQFPLLANQVKKIKFQTTHRPFTPLKNHTPEADKNASKPSQNGFHPHDPKFINEKKTWREFLGDSYDPELVDLLASLSLQLPRPTPSHPKG